MSAGPSNAASPQVSVVMIFFNAERFIDDAIASVLTQTYTQWELLLIDDGSSDASTAIALRYAEAHPDKIRYLEHDNHANRGTGASRNLGIRAARGPYVAFLDADDIFLPQRLARHMEAFAHHSGIGLVISSSLYWHSWNAPQRRVMKARDEIVGVCVQPNAPLNPPDLLIVCLTVRDAPMPGTCDITFRRELASDAIPPQFIGQYEDQALICQLLLKARALVLNECLAQYRQHAGSLTGRARSTGEYRPGRTHEARFRFVHWLRDHLRAQGVHSDALNAKLQRELWPLSHPRLSRIREAMLDIGRGAKRALAHTALRVLPYTLIEKALEYRAARKQARIRRRTADTAPIARRRTTP